MKKILSYLLMQLKYIFINPFWTKWTVIVVIVISLLLNGLIWYLYQEKFNQIIHLTPIGYASGVMLLNIFLAAVIYPKQQMISYVFLGTTLLIQVYILFLLKISSYLGVY